MKRSYVAYFRVSTARQGRSGLGLEAQRSAVMQFLDGGQGRLLCDFTEIESGKKVNRAQLEAALSSCRLHGAILVIAKLDRLARNVEFIARLMNSGVEFVAVDMPHANRLTIHILAAMAEHEREMISVRTRAALAQAKKRGVRLGGDRGKAALVASQGGQASAKARREIAAQRAADMRPIIAAIEQEGAISLRAIAEALNRQGIPAPRGGRWSSAQVARVKAAAAARRAA